MVISGFTQFVGSVTRYIVMFNQRHPDKDATCIDYGITNIMLPMVLVSANVGVIFNVVFPPIIITILLTLVIAYLTYVAARKSCQLYKKENEAMKAVRSGSIVEFLEQEIRESIKSGQDIRSSLSSDVLVADVMIPSPKGSTDLRKERLKLLERFRKEQGNNPNTYDTKM